MVVDIVVAAAAVAAQAQCCSLVLAAISCPPSDRLLGAFAGDAVTVVCNVDVEIVVNTAVVSGITVRVDVALRVAVRFAVIAAYWSVAVISGHSTRSPHFALR